MISTKKIGAVVAASFLFTGVLSNIAMAAPKPSTKPIAATPSSAPNSTPKVVNISCSPTTAHGDNAAEYKARRSAIQKPKVQKFTKNKVFTLTTNCGDIVIETYAKSAPVTISMLAGLINGNFYNKTVCHRMIYSQSASLLQCGDPTASGYGGPSFQFNDENLPKSELNNYPMGTVAMANSTQVVGGALTNQNSNGSQFFIMAGDTTLDPFYTVWGKVTKGLEIVQAVVNNGTADGQSVGQPKFALAIEKASVR
jgi:peptidyl-prolyl cis-trans isomerase B (cyclophilin B)